jgi:hypothetical protein
MNEHGWLKLAMENTKDTKAPLTLQIGVILDGKAPKCRCAF